MLDNMTDTTCTFLMVGDVVGVAGRIILQSTIETLKKEHAADIVIINGENSAHGSGITPSIVEFLKNLGADVITSGNHIWHKRDIVPYITTHTDLLRPANYPSGVPGTGITIIRKARFAAAVVNVEGRVFMRETLDCPFRTLETLLTFLRDKTKLVFVDFHAEATSEKQAFATYFDGKVTAVVGTHTHVQTADERILPSGTAYITDVGMAGAQNSLLGMQAQPIIQRFLTQMPVKFSVELAPPYCMGAVVVRADISSGMALSIKRIFITREGPAAPTSDDCDTLGGW